MTLTNRLFHQNYLNKNISHKKYGAILSAFNVLRLPDR
ncbi:hypothetical protein HNP82_001881 [Catenibacillus scindens]|uniref:Uncharacterized protein n=1 Tax=Catenibacillus scindens TaxID=673271 RepID=A0A7W8HB40_9FIRM|nr:hypothetical protein [Catenibacillus scindens]